MTHQNHFPARALAFLSSIFLKGWSAPGGTSPNEYSLNLGSLGSGNHYLQILSEDHSGSDGYDVKVTGDVAPVPEPAIMFIFGTEIAGSAAVGRRKNIN